MAIALSSPTPQPATPNGGQPAYILFAVWFKPHHGAERYREYLAAASPIAEKHGARRIEGLLTIESLHGSVDPDYIYVVEWPNIDAYENFLKDPHYRAVAPMLSDATERVAVLHTRKV